jgi:hypothetical protein
VDGAKDEDARFLEAEQCLMIFKGSRAYKSHRQCRITEQEVNAVHTLVAPTRL